MRHRPEIRISCPIGDHPVAIGDTADGPPVMYYTHRNDGTFYLGCWTNDSDHLYDLTGFFVKGNFVDCRRHYEVDIYRRAFMSSTYSVWFTQGKHSTLYMPSHKIPIVNLTRLEAEATFIEYKDSLIPQFDIMNKMSGGVVTSPWEWLDVVVWAWARKNRNELFDMVGMDYVKKHGVRVRTICERLLWDHPDVLVEINQRLERIR